MALAILSWWKKRVLGAMGLDRLVAKKMAEEPKAAIPARVAVMPHQLDMTEAAADRGHKG